MLFGDLFAFDPNVQHISSWFAMAAIVDVAPTVPHWTRAVPSPADELNGGKANRDRT